MCRHILFEAVVFAQEETAFSDRNLAFLAWAGSSPSPQPPSCLRGFHAWRRCVCWFSDSLLFRIFYGFISCRLWRKKSGIRHKRNIQKTGVFERVTRSHVSCFCLLIYQTRKRVYFFTFILFIYLLKKEFFSEVALLFLPLLLLLLLLTRDLNN